MGPGCSRRTTLSGYHLIYGRLFTTNKFKTLKTTKITYWVSTSIIAGMIILSAYNYMTREEVKVICRHLGFPDYFRIEVAVAKFLGALALLAPISGRIKEWAYFGFVIIFISAPIAHIASADPLSQSFGALGYLAVLAISYVSWHKRRVAVLPARA